jgi:hypothetical protein
MILDLLEQGDDLRDLPGDVLIDVLRSEQPTAPDEMLRTAGTVVRWAVIGTLVTAFVGFVASLGTDVPGLALFGLLLLVAVVSSWAYFRTGSAGSGAILLASSVALAAVALFALFYVASPLSNQGAVGPWQYVNVLSCSLMPCAVACHLQFERRSR